MTEQSANRLLEKLEKQVPALMEVHAVPGLSLSLLRGGHDPANRAFGVRNADTQEPVTVNTVFEAASLTKPLLAVAAMLLCEEGVLEMDCPLSGFLPASHLTDDPRADRITLRHVLSHTTGFPNWRKKGEDLRTHFEPGARFSYSGEGFVLLGRVIEQVVGQTLSEVLQMRVLAPLGLDQTTFLWTGSEDLPVAVGHNTEGKAQTKALWPEVNAAASLHCTAHDLARFMAAILSSREDGFLRPETHKTMFMPQAPVNSLAPWHDGWPNGEAIVNSHVFWGLGWGLQQTSTGTSIWHWGDNGCYRAFAFGMPSSGDGIVILTNGENGQQVVRPILETAAGSDLPALDWLDSLYGLA